MQSSRELGAEFFGTFTLVSAVCGAALFSAPSAGLVAVAFAVGLSVLAMAYAVGHISGGHFNPAVTLGLVAGGRFEIGKAAGYIIGRNWPAEIEPSYAGYSIGKWTDEGGTGRFNLLEVETRAFKGPRAYDTSGLPLHSDNQTVVKERIFQDKADQNILYDEISVIDHALTRPWVVTRKYQRDPDPQPVWREVVCTENNQHVHIGNENYFIGAEGYLMPAKKGQVPPDLRYFKQSQK